MPLILLSISVLMSGKFKSGTIFSHFLLTDDWETAKADIDVINAIRDGEKRKKEEDTKAAEEPHDHGHDEPHDDNKEDL